MAESSGWSESDIPDQTGRTALVTGANSGLGLRTARVLAAAGAHVLLGCRSTRRGERALHEVSILARTKPTLVTLDLADLASVRKAVANVRELTGDALDILVNNAGVMGTPKGTTVDGFETQFGTNYVGHAALTWLLMPALRGGTDARVVTVSSRSAIAARLNLDDPNFTRRRYNAATAYAQAKLAEEVFAMELDRRLRAHGEPVSSLAAHPGYAATGLAQGMARSYPNRTVRRAVEAAGRVAALFGQSIRLGALPQLYAATAPGVSGGDYYGPRGLAGLWGRPGPARPTRAALDPSLGARLWELTARLTGITPDPA
ncbi:NAD(P)-dependent dehydrogenase (short-subunit alcohol dehydrogenase family) [Saccharomonospora amisosensis]|uniref:NAD(P)-dependent dehydrogenase (Short-subunit alcohol dehydrogenase family) n=1 Tax=Saccharomonospora amisosensis TaxID=1128677 RepID=A0A7X5ZSF9_9PSEU|nr:oxidoreductase [Saccharomonospora amisosensis]NIJ13511.1 NAD(P)-dependent dehydrogenase (short-subunit alcohol dehydrogenase family) [Saccharomonospora amisosensis]